MPSIENTKNMQRDIAQSVDAIEESLRDRLGGGARIAYEKSRAALGTAAHAAARAGRSTGGFVREHPYGSGGAVLGLAGLITAFVFRHELAELGRRAMDWWED